MDFIVWFGISVGLSIVKFLFSFFKEFIKSQITQFMNCHKID
jgi:hypothetical protein